jgi:hypothetical protein
MDIFEYFIREMKRMKSLDMKLSASGLANIPIHEDYNDFEFIVGGSRY